MIEMTHRDNGKEKYDSHDIRIREQTFSFYNAENDVWSHNPFDISGYGATKEEAIEDFKKKFIYVMKELKAFETLLLDTNVITDNIIEVDCMGKDIVVKNKKCIEVEL